MNTLDKIIQLYPELENVDPLSVGIVLWDNGDGTPIYIKEWNHKTLAQPTQEQLDGISA